MIPYLSDSIKKAQQDAQQANAHAPQDSQAVGQLVTAWRDTVPPAPATVAVTPTTAKPADFASLKTRLFVDAEPSLYARAVAGAQNYAENEAVVIEYIASFLQAYNEAEAEGRTQERERLAATFALPEAEGREPLMRKLALTTHLTPDAIQVILGATPQLPGVTQSEFSKHLAHLGLSPDPKSKEISTNPWVYAFSQTGNSVAHSPSSVPASPEPAHPKNVEG